MSDSSAQSSSHPQAEAIVGSPPQPPRRAHTWDRPTGSVEDPYAWMRSTDDPEFLAHLHAENDYSAAFFANHAETIETIYDEIRSRVQESDMSVPVPHEAWWYVTQTIEGRNYPLHHRGPTAERATEYLLLDENVEAEGHEYFDLGAFDLAPNGSLLAWAADTAGDEHYTLRVRDLTAIEPDRAGHDLDDTITDTAHAGVAWSADSRFLFYVTADEQERPDRVWRHEIGTDRADDVEVFHEPDERFFVSIGLTRSDRFVVIQCGSKLTADALLIPAGNPEAPAQRVFPRVEGVEYSVDDWGDRLVIVTNEGDAVDFEVRTVGVDPDTGIVRAAPAVTDPAVPDPAVADPAVADPAVADPAVAGAGLTEVLIAHRPGRRITGVDAYADYCVVHQWNDAQPAVTVVDRAGTVRPVPASDTPHDIEPVALPNWTSSVLRWTAQALDAPVTLLEADVVLDGAEPDATGTPRVLRQVPTPNIALDDYVSSRLWATADDGTQVPVDVVHRADTELDGTAPVCLYAYGAYEISLPPWFSVARLSLLDRGWVWALAHPRGGGELGRQWYLDGKLESKRNTFTDVIAVAEHLVETGVARSGAVALRGGSAGGLMAGACVTMRPDLFASIVAEVPFVDVVTTMHDTDLPLTVTEWEEWGDPRIEPYASYIASYSPYDNTVAAPYPAIYATAGVNDPRVSVHEPAKWVARLRDVTTSDAPVVFHCEMGAGHGGPSGRYAAWRDEARTLAFLLATVAT